MQFNFKFSSRVTTHKSRQLKRYLDKYNCCVTFLYYLSTVVKIEMDWMGTLVTQLAISNTTGCCCFFEKKQMIPKKNKLI